MNEKSYTELMKISAMKKSHLKEAFIQDLYIDMLLTEVLLTSEKEKLQKKIDEAIDSRDKPTFLRLSKQFTQLSKRFGT
jgi:uncharacterized protein YpiB (UPF0302 family)